MAVDVGISFVSHEESTIFRRGIRVENIGVTPAQGIRRDVVLEAGKSTKLTDGMSKLGRSEWLTIESTKDRNVQKGLGLWDLSRMDILM
jgi:hypothetical protein